ncbi:hypothetical protein LTR08_003858 [Meristemomyces frigidus]|nr:hypothetical protein LTR08_003858 [Meristemomyces frigidus]
MAPKPSAKRPQYSDSDRALTTPPHTGPTIFPNHPLFARLVRFAHDSPTRLCVRDDNTNQQATHLQLLTDVLALRERLWTQLSTPARRALDRREAVYIAVLAPGGYEFTVAVLAVLALGAAVVPMSIALPADEAKHFATASRSVAVLCSSGSIKLGVALETLIKSRDATSTFSCIPVASSIFTTPPLNPSQLLVSSDESLSDNDPAVVIFTSGTTGPPKGAVMRRAYTFSSALAVADHYRITPEDIILHLLPVHHATGLGIMFFPFLISGALIEFKSGAFSPEWTWERWRQAGLASSLSGGIGQEEGRLTFFSGVPTIYMRLKRHFENALAKHPNVDEYIAGARQLRASLCGTSALPLPISNFWTSILGGRKILLRYGATEIGAVFKVRLDDQTACPDGSVGKMLAGCDVRLSEGDSGEILVKSPEMFQEYLFDAEATARAHTVDGYYRTGDIARRDAEGNHYILGRESVDIIKSGGYKISALDIEREILGLPYVAEVMVVGVPDEEFGERVAAAVCLKDASEMEMEIQQPDATTEAFNLTLDRLRQDLRSRLAGYKLPTLLRIVEGELPKSGTGKVVKKVLGPQFFPPDYVSRPEEVQVWRLLASIEVGGAKHKL